MGEWTASGGRRSWFAFFLLPFYHSDRLEEAKKYALTRKDTKLVQEVSELNRLMAAGTLLSVRTPGGLHPECKRFSAEALLFAAAACEPVRERLLLQYVRKREALPVFLTGNDLIRHGLKPGASFAGILTKLETEALDGRIQSREQALEWLKVYCRSSAPEQPDSEK
jgi:hypothetical protein